MKVLIVSHYFYPVNTPRAFRATELANEFARQGHDVKVITHRNDNFHSELESKYGYKIKDIGKQIFKPINLSGRGRLLTLKLIWRRVMLLMFEYPDIQLMWLAKQALKVESGYDLLISIAVPHSIHWGVALARKKKRHIAKVWVADCGDPYMGCKTDSFKKLFYFGLIEKLWNKRCDYISVPHGDMLNDFYEKFQQKIAIIPQGFKFGDLKKSEVKNNIPTFAYAGVLSLKYRNPLLFVEYLLELNINFKFIVYSETQIFDYLKDKAKGKIEIRPFLPRKDLLEELSKMDFVVNFENKSILSNNSNYSAPSKLIDYAIVGKPILSVNTESPDYSNIDKFLSGDYSGKLVVENTDRFRIENVVKKFIELTPEMN